MNPPAPIKVKILSLGTPERYALRRLVVSAMHEPGQENPGLVVEISEVKDPSHINRYVQVLIMPSLVINEKVVCTGRLPARQEIVEWLQQASVSAGSGS